MQSNADMDFLSSTKSDPVYHFDSERVDEAAAVLRQLWAQTLLSVRARQYQSARRSLGQLFHSLQVLRRSSRRSMPEAGTLFANFQEFWAHSS